MDTDFGGKDPTAYLLDGMYKNVKIGSERIICAMPKVQDRAMIRDMTECLEKYSSFSKSLENMMHERGIVPAPPGFLSKIGAKAGVSANTVIDPSGKNIARVCIGSSKSTVRRLERMRDQVESRCDATAVSMCEDIIERERINYQKMEAYL